MTRTRATDSRGFMRAGTALAVTFVLFSLSGCRSLGPSSFVNYDFDFSYVQRLAVLPFQNLTQAEFAGRKMTHLFISEMLALELFDVVEPGDLTRQIRELGIRDINAMSKDEVQRLGESLGVQALVSGSVGEYSERRTGSTSTSEVMLSATMIEVDTGTVIWSVVHTRQGGGTLSRLFGTPGDPVSESARKLVQQALETIY